MPASCDFGLLRRIAFFIIVALWLFTVPSAVTATASRGQPAVDHPQEAEPPQHRAASPVMTPSAVPPQNSDHYQAEHLGLPEFQADQPAAYQAPAADPKLSVDEHRVLDLSEEPFPSSEQYAAPAPQLPDCSTIDRLRKAQAVQPVPELVLLSTADGHVTAVDAHGQVVWRTDTGRPLLEASLKKITLNDNRGGGSATFIPSLDGSLYKFDGKQIEVVATADSVIYSSVKTDPWVLTGGRETKTFGIDPRTGEVRYVCTMDGGCTNFTTTDAPPVEGSRPSGHQNSNEKESNRSSLPGSSGQETLDSAVLIIRRHTQTVRAIEPRSGREEWHYSVGENELYYVDDRPAGCAEGGHRPVTMGDDDFIESAPHRPTELRVVANKGQVSGTHHDSQTVNWTVELGSPIVGAWQLSAAGQLEEVDLFEPSHLVGMESQGSQPIFFVGIFRQQLYLQQNPRVVRNNRMLANYWFNQQRGFGSITGENRPLIDYNPGPSEERVLDTASSGPQVIMEMDDPDLGTDTALIPLSPREILERVDPDNCFYFMQEDPETQDCKAQSLYPSLIEEDVDGEKIEEVGEFDDHQRPDRAPEDNDWPDENAEDAPIVYVVNSLGNYWREIAIISFICSVAVNLVVSQLLKRLGYRNGPPRPALTLSSSSPSSGFTESGETASEGLATTPSLTPGSTTKTVTPDGEARSSGTNSLASFLRSDSGESSATATASTYVSRYTTDFVPVRCLGKGGFGIVFESRNKIDDCSYAVKRIRLPARKGAREKVLREVKALAKLDHQHIVRYYNAWLETPPPGWQQEMDTAWKATLPISTTNALSLGGEGTPAETGETGTTSGATDAATSIIEDTAEVKDIRKLIDNYNPFKPFDGLSDAWQESDAGDRAFADFTQESCGSWITDEVDGSKSNKDISAEEEMDSEESGDLSALLPRQLDCLQENEDSIVFASDEKSSRSGLFVTRRRKSSKGADCPIDRSSSMNGVEEDREPENAGDRKNCVVKQNGERHADAVAALAGAGSSEPDGVRQPIYLYIQIELCKKESLKDWLAEKKTLDDRGHDKVLEVFYQIALAVDYIHECGLIHRDLKPSNIFFSMAGDVVKVGDFGLVTDTDGLLGVHSTCLSSPDAKGDTANDTRFSANSTASDLQLTDKVGTQLYMSPEQISGSKYNQKVDIFALAIILFELLWALPTQMERVRTLSAVKELKFPKGFKREFNDEYQLIRSMLTLDPTLRPTAQEVLHHSLFNGIRQNNAKRSRRRTNSSRSQSSHEGAR